MVTVGALMMVAAIGLFGLNLLTWLRVGTWPDYTAAQMFSDLGFGYPTVSWVGVQKVLDLIMSASAAAFLFAGGLLTAWIGGGMLEGHDRRVRAADQARRDRELEAIRAEREERYAKQRERDRRKEKGRTGR